MQERGCLLAYIVRRMNRLVFVSAIALAAGACGGSSADRPTPTPTVEPAPAPQASEGERLQAFFKESFERDLARSPITQTYLGIKLPGSYGKWDDISDARAQEEHELDKADLEQLHRFDVDSLSAEDRLSYQLFEYETQQALEGFRWRFHDYPVHQMHGLHSMVPSFLMNFHSIDSVDDAEAYISRLEGVQPLFAQLEQNMVERQEKGILPPKFVFPKVIDDSRNILRGAPFDDSKTPSDLLADFTRKVQALELPDAEEEALIARASKALIESVKPAYQSLIALAKRQEAVATTDDGAWKLPDGAAYYDYALAATTTTDMNAEEIHALGLQEVERIHGEMRGIMKKVGFKGDLQKFFVFMRENPRFYLTNDEAGRAEYLDQARQYIAGITERLDELFITKPKAPLVVKRVEEYREKSAGTAFYEGPSADSTRPGIFYANLHQMKDMPPYQLEALVYHEGIPGHHMQIAIATEQNDLPMFRRFHDPDIYAGGPGLYTAYIEGWGLYSELLPKEIGFYQDPYSDFGRLAMELWRAARLVVDTGLHAKRWTREQAIEWLVKNTPDPRGEAVKAIERYIVMPSQATAYKIGMLKILELREKARAALGDKFDIREFHEVVLTPGAVPLTILEANVDGWIAAKQAG